MEKELDPYTLKVYALLDTMKAGDVLQIIKITKPETRDQFISVVKKYMDEHEWQAGLSFGKAYAELRKTDFAFITQNKKIKV